MRPTYFVKLVSGLFLAASLQLPAQAVPGDLPAEVSNFLAERESCDHWRGEDGYDPARRAEINWSVCQYCAGTDHKLAHLKKKYRSSKVVMDRLVDLEPQVEMHREAAKRQCRASRKARWVG